MDSATLWLTECNLSPEPFLSTGWVELLVRVGVRSAEGGIVDHVFEGVSEAELIEVMGEATRDESTAIAQRLLLGGELYARRAKELAETFWWRTDPTEEVAAEISAAQNISRARAVGQIHYGRTLWERLPEVAKVFVRGVIDFRMVSTIIARTENVDDEVITRLDAALARHVEKWMRLSGPKLRDRLDQGGRVRSGRGAGAADS